MWVFMHLEGIYFLMDCSWMTVTPALMVVRGVDLPSILFECWY